MSYNPNLLPDHSKVDLGINYVQNAKGIQKKQSDLEKVLCVIVGVGFLFAAVFFMLPMPPLGLLFGLIGLILLPPIHTWMEKKLRFRFTWGIKIIVLLILFVPSIILTGITVNNFQKYTVKKQHEKELADKEKETKDKQNKIEADKKEKSRIDSLTFYNSKANSEFKKNKYLLGISYLDKALRFANHSDENDIYDKRATNYFKAGKYEDALKDYSTLIKNGYLEKETYYQRALCYQKLNKKREAVYDLKEAMQLGNKDAEKLYNRLNPIKKRITGYVTRCCDGSISYSTGRGTCSHHDGVCNWNEPQYEEYREYE